MDNKNFAKNVLYGVVGCATDESLCSTYSVSKVPEVKLFENGAVQSTYSGDLNTGIQCLILSSEVIFEEYLQLSINRIPRDLIKNLGLN